MEGFDSIALGRCLQTPERVMLDRGMLPGSPTTPTHVLVVVPCSGIVVGIAIRAWRRELQSRVVRTATQDTGMMLRVDFIGFRLILLAAQRARSGC